MDLSNECQVAEVTETGSRFFSRTPAAVRLVRFSIYRLNDLLLWLFIIMKGQSTPLRGLGLRGSPPHGDDGRVDVGTCHFTAITKHHRAISSTQTVMVTTCHYLRQGDKHSFRNSIILRAQTEWQVARMRLGGDAPVLSVVSPI